MNKKIKLGDKVKDIITNFTGIVTAITEYLDGYTQIGIQSEKLKDEIPLDIQWFYANRVIETTKENNSIGFKDGRSDFFDE